MNAFPRLIALFVPALLAGCAEGGWGDQFVDMVAGCTEDTHGQAWGDCIHDQFPVTLNGSTGTREGARR